MTPASRAHEHQTEWTHIVQTRLGILGVPADARPTPEQHKIAAQEADEWIARLELQEWDEKQWESNEPKTLPDGRSTEQR